jgi:hypothetical protein
MAMSMVVDVTTVHPLPRLRSLPASLPLEGAVRIELEEGVPVFRASGAARARIEELLLRQQESRLTAEEEKELDRYEEIDDYLSFVNRLVRNILQTELDEGA